MPTATGRSRRSRSSSSPTARSTAPGQTIYYKGIAILVDQEGDNYKVLPNEQVTVVFSDVNGKEIARQTRGTNDYGSFSGIFTAPRDRLMGRMMIRADVLQGTAWVSVEEYKRPKFQVTLDAPKTAARLGGEVQLEGKAMAYTGRGGGRGQGPLSRRPPGPLSRLVVLVLRLADAARRPPGDRPRHGPNRGRRHASRSSSSPSPTSRCRKRTSRSSSSRSRADVTDTNGETRSAQRTVQAGYTALRASLSAAEWLTVRQAVRDHALPRPPWTASRKRPKGR